MHNIVVLEAGFPPWSPTSDAALVREYDRWNVPLVGVFRQRQGLYLFANIVGGDRATGGWAYAAVEEDDVRQLDAAGDPAELWQEIESLLGSRPAVTAVAADAGGERGGPEVQTHAVSWDHADYRHLRRRIEEQVRAHREATAKFRS